MGVAGFSLKWKVLTEDSLGAPTRPGMIRPAGGADYRLVAQQDAPEEEFGTAGDPSHAAEDRDACDDDDEPDESEPLIPRDLFSQPGFR
ncbi:unnamed protein product [Prorocentrum cordatum]|uniref:Uncharacterized protein n=1 Tax=Prorocentrum cordatum TaxID=2364126 RepID=A0ABN9Q9W5_9DINO|nr:unnamed protein product [Polarella glacialis]